MTQTLRRHTLSAAVVALCVMSGLVAVPVTSQAAVPDSCGDTILILDESGSVSPHEANVRDAVNAFFGSLIDSGVQAGVIEFGSAAKKIIDYTAVDATSVADTFGPYVNATAGGDVYDSPSQLGAYTNWDDALDEATQINANSGVAPVVLLLTDGDPTAYNLDRTGETGGVHVNGVSVEALDRAIEEAEEIRSQGSHLIAVGVGSGLTNDDSIDRLKQVAGPDVYDGSGIFDLDTTDVVLVPNFEDLPEVMALIASAMCADPAIAVEKSVSSPVVVAGTEVTYTVEVTNSGNVDLHNVVLEDPTVPACSADIGYLSVGETTTIECTSTIWTPVTNNAKATGTDPFGTPVEDDGSATTTLIATGTGTPGYWKNHLDMWPILDDTVLIGDWNHNWVCDINETCIELTADEAMTALANPPRGDMTWNLGRPLVAAWLNISAGNQSSCIAEVIDLSTGWLLSHPLGSDIRGSDNAWDQASNWATLLDDYNNGKLCAEHRDTGDENATTQTNTASSNEQTEDSDMPKSESDQHKGKSNDKPPQHSRNQKNKQELSHP